MKDVLFVLVGVAGFSSFIFGFLGVFVICLVALTSINWILYNKSTRI